MGEIKDLEEPVVRTMVGATNGSVDHHIHLATQPTRKSLSDDMRILDGLKNPTGDRCVGRS